MGKRPVAYERTVTCRLGWEFCTLVMSCGLDRCFMKVIFESDNTVMFGEIAPGSAVRDCLWFSRASHGDAKVSRWCWIDGIGLIVEASRQVSKLVARCDVGFIN